jgi:hypothetical protein
LVQALSSTAETIRLIEKTAVQAKALSLTIPQSVLLKADFASCED